MRSFAALRTTETLTLQLVERHVLVDPDVGRHAQHALGHDVAQDLVGAAGDAEARAADPLRLEARGMRHVFLHDAARAHQLHGEGAHVLHLGRRHDLDDRRFGARRLALGERGERAIARQLQALLLDVPVADLAAHLLIAYRRAVLYLDPAAKL